MTLWIIAVAAAGAATVLALTALLLARTPRRGRAAASPEALRTEIERLRAAAEFAGIVEPSELCDRVLQVALAETGAEAGALALRGVEHDSPVVSSLRLTDAELAWLAPSLHAENDAPIITRYLYDDETVLSNRFATVTFVPVYDIQGAPIGTIAAIWRRDIGESADAQVRALELVADDARAALTSAQRFHEIEGASLRDRDTGLPNRRAFVDNLDAEIWKARQDPSVSATLLNVELPNDAPVSATALVEVARIVESALGGAEVCRVGARQLATIVGKPRADLGTTVEQIREWAAAGGHGDALVGAVELEENEDASSYLQRALMWTASPAAATPPKVKFTVWSGGRAS